MERIRLNIQNNVNADIPIQVFSDPDPNTNIGAVTKYRCNLTGLSFSPGNITSLSISYRSTQGGAFTNFTYSGNILSFDQLLSILNGAGIGIFYKLQSGGITYLEVSNQNYFYGALTLLPATAYQFMFNVSLPINDSVIFAMDFSVITDVTINWDDGTIENFPNQSIGSHTYNHVLGVITGKENYTVTVLISSVSGLESVNLSISGNQNVTEVFDIYSMSSLEFFYVGSNQLEILPALSLALTVVDCGSNKLPSSEINWALSQLVAAGLPNGTFDSAGQTPAATPTGQGVTDKNTLISNGWTVTTD